MLNNPAWEVHFFWGKDLKSGIQPIEFSSAEFCSKIDRLHELKNNYLAGRILVWQEGVIGSCLKSNFDQAIFTGDMYCLSTWIAAIICRLRGIKVTFWSHGLYGNEGKLKLLIRKSFYRLAHKHLLYERRGKSLMKEQGFNSDKLYVIFNSLDYDAQLTFRKRSQAITRSDVYPFFSRPTLPVIVFIGRLTHGKKLKLLINVVKQINNNMPILNLIFIGDGSEKKSLQDLGQLGLDEGWIHFTGACYDEEIIGQYLFHADICVSPGNVGLTAIHSLSYGTPVFTHNNLQNQGPEVEAITGWHNGLLFKENDADDLKRKIELWLKINADRDNVRERCYEVVDKYYNPNYQLKVIDRLLSNQEPEI